MCSFPQLKTKRIKSIWCNRSIRADQFSVRFVWSTPAKRLTRLSIDIDYIWRDEIYFRLNAERLSVVLISTNSWCVTFRGHNNGSRISMWTHVIFHVSFSPLSIFIFTMWHCECGDWVSDRLTNIKCVREISSRLKEADDDDDVLTMNENISRE